MRVMSSWEEGAESKDMGCLQLDLANETVTFWAPISTYTDEDKFFHMFRKLVLKSDQGQRPLRSGHEPLHDGICC